MMLFDLNAKCDLLLESSHRNVFLVYCDYNLILGESWLRKQIKTARQCRRTALL